jgi:hypothetical protein
MPTNFLASLGGTLAERWATTLMTPAFVFWLGGIIAWVSRFGWKPLEQWLLALSEPLQITVIVGGVIAIATSAFAIQRFDRLILRLLEGYWPRGLAALKRWRIKHYRRWQQQAENRWQTLLGQRETKGLTPEDLAEYIQLDAQLRQFPPQSERVMPTRLGNMLRAAESQPSDKYGLDAVICMPRLWLVLPEAVKTELQTAREELNTAARIWLWGLLFSVWLIWAWWALPVGLLLMVFAYRWLLDAAATYGDLLESTFDLHRMALYQALHWPLPQNPAQERPLGLMLTAYLWRGSDQAQPTFTLE